MKQSFATLVLIASVLAASIAFAGQPVAMAQGGTGSSREDAIAIGTPGRVSNYELTVLEVIPDAWPVIQSANQFNDPPAEGHQFLMVRLSVTYNGVEPTDPGFDLSIDSVGNRGRGYSTFQNSCGSFDNDEYSIGEMFQGAKAEFATCWAVATEDVNSLVMFVGPLFDMDGENVWFSLGNDQNVDPMAAFAAYQRHGSLVESSTREQPVPVGDTGSVGNWEISIISVTPVATDVVLAANQFNQPPPEGHQFFMAKVAVAYLGQEPVDATFELNFQAVGNLGRGYTTFDNSCGTYDGDENDIGTMFYGAYAEADVCWQVPAEDADSLLMYVEPFFSFDDEVVWFSLGNEVAPSPATSSPPAQGTSSTIVQDSSRENPIAIGSTGLVENYQITVVEVIPDATNVVLGQNQFNDPPDPGQQFVMVRVSLLYTGQESADPAFELSFKAVGALNRGYSTYDNDCGVYEESEYDVGEMFPGSSAQVNVCWSVPVEDAPTLVMYVEPFFSFDADPVWFAIQP